MSKKTNNLECARVPERKTRNFVFELSERGLELT